MYRNFIIFVLLVVIWSLFFATYKYFTWGIFQNETITLQFIAGYLSLGSFISFIVGAFIYEVLKERKFHFIISSLAVLSIFGIYLYYLFPIYSDVIIIGGFTLFIGFIYGLWTVLRSIIISGEINKNFASDTFINGIVNIAFISSIVIGSIVGGILVEKLNEKGCFIIMFILIISVIIGLFISNNLTESDNKTIKDRFEEYKNNYKKDFLFVVKKYYIEMIFIGLLLVIATVLRQKAIEYITLNMNTKQSTASFILLFSALGGIIGNFISMKVFINKRLLFLISCILFGISTILLPFFIFDFVITSIIAFFAGIFFGTSYNLIESEYLKNIAIDDKKSYGGASLGMFLALVVGIVMLLIDSIENILGFTGMYIFLGIILFYIGLHKFLSIYTKNKKIGGQ